MTDASADRKLRRIAKQNGFKISKGTNRYESSKDCKATGYRVIDAETGDIVKGDYYEVSFNEAAFLVGAKDEDFR